MSRNAAKLMTRFGKSFWQRATRHIHKLNSVRELVLTTIDGKSPEGLLIFALNLCFLPCIVAHIPEVVIGTSQEG